MDSDSRSGLNRYVFRQGRRAISSQRLIDELDAALAALSSGAGPAEEALLRAGELECILADHDARGAKELARVTDRLADALVAGGDVQRIQPLTFAARAAVDLPDRVSVSPPEGFAYYGLQPLSFARLAEGLPLASASVAVIGIRSIGTTLSAVVAAALRGRGVQAERTTVRPTGHPYDRSVRLEPGQIDWLTAYRARGARFVVVDEGPGLSGSSFLAVGDGLVRAGIAPRCITFLCSRAPNPAELVAPDAERRWSAFATPAIVAPTTLPPDAGRRLSAGLWREHLYPEEALWPASWTMLERIKHLSGDGRRLFKFEGLGRWGAAARQRAQQVFEAGFGPPAADAGDGFVMAPFLEARPLARADLSRSVLERLADYCAFRAAAFPAADADPADLVEMTRFNATQMIGQPIELPLRVERPVIADARLMPHEWLQPSEGPILKVDAAAHGDDHFLPGPTDIAWDLAGAAVEWRLDRAARGALLERYQRASGDRAEGRLGAFVVAYLVFRAALMEMAASSMSGTGEAGRLLGDARRYRRMLQRELGRRPAT